MTISTKDLIEHLEHELQGRWVCFVGAENDKHLKATHPAPFTPITADMVTNEMLEVIEDEISMGRNAWDLAPHKELVAAAINAWGAKK